VRLWIAAGGTGGHVYPALAVVERLAVSRLPSAVSDRQSAVLWIGGEGGVEEALVKRAGLDFVAISAGGLHGVAAIKAIKNGLKLIAGTFQTLRLISRFKPEALLTTGGFVAGPVAVACWLRRVPIVVYLPDVEPGQAVKFVARLATKIAVTTDESTKYFPASKVIVTGYPTRSDLAQADRLTAIQYFDLDPNRKTVLVFGGSKGARSINRAVGAILEMLLAKCQVIHISGSTDADEVRARRAALADELKSRYHVFEYVHDMGLAFAAADLVVSRAGASILGEYPLFGLPSILVPYPYAWRYQRVNAGVLVSRGAAIQLDDATLSEHLLPAIERLMDDNAQRRAMSAAARSLARPDPAQALAKVIAAAVGAQA
jgi:UDP-N-acetylglucosamine--N-acetylmuramyl-(pentapeptide) pyrophosphoryl-undecaprenol N-acetylglucosamine transferase